MEAYSCNQNRTSHPCNFPIVSPFLGWFTLQSRTRTAVIWHSRLHWILIYPTLVTRSSLSFHPPQSPLPTLPYFQLIPPSPPPTSTYIPKTGRHNPTTAASTWNLATANSLPWSELPIPHAQPHITTSLIVTKMTNRNCRPQIHQISRIKIFFPKCQWAK